MTSEAADSAITAADILADGVDDASFGGQRIRKGTVAAFVANAGNLEKLTPGTPEFDVVRDALIAAVPQLRAIGLLDIFEPRSQALRDIVAQTP